MDPKIEQLLAEYEQRSAAEWPLFDSLPAEQRLRRRDEFLLAVGPNTGRLINILVRESKAKNILELGTSYGYSTVWLAEAARETGGRVVTLELQPEKIAYARSKLGEVGLASVVDFRRGDALQTLPALDGPFDFVLLDVWKDLYVPCFDLCLPKLAKDALIVADNMLFPEATRPHAEAYRRHVRSTGRFDSVLLSVGSGLEVSRCLGA